MHKLFIATFLLFFKTIEVCAQDADPDFLNLEFEFGIGYSHSTNQNYFNDSQGINPKGGFGINFALRHHFNYNWSAGAHLLLSADEISNYDPDLVLGYFSEVPLSIANLNLGFNGKYTHNLQRWQPFALAGIGVSLGSLVSIEYQEQVNSSTGIAMNLGIGIGYMASSSIMISASVSRNIGIAWWSRAPSQISINKQFDPGFWTISANISVFLPEEFY